MKAVVCKAFGPPESLVIDELPAPKPGAGEVVVTVKAASVNFPDVLVIQNKYQVKPTLPLYPRRRWRRSDQRGGRRREEREAG